MIAKLPALEINPPDGAPQAAVIWLHGLGASGHDFFQVAGLLALQYPTTRFVLPHAPMRAIRANQGLRMRAWYDIYSWDFHEHEDLPGLAAMAQSIEALIEAEHQRGIPYHRIVLAGFSQGGAMALYTGLRYPHRLGGILGLSTYLPDPYAYAVLTPSQKPLPVFLAHGRQDSIIPLAMAEEAATLLEQLGCRVEWHCYEMEHTVVEAEIQAIADFLRRFPYGTALDHPVQG